MNTNYAGFWMRFAAYIIDIIIVYVVQSFVFIPLFGLLGISFAASGGDYENMSEAEAMGMAGGIMAVVGTTILLASAISILYWTLMESSKYQATVGKMVLGLKVTDVEGKNLDFVKSLIRNVSKIISGVILYIGYIMAGFTEKKQGLHDMIAGTIVVKK
jgi:uncharacterized RDD family membrane protein YckC